jgi:hypothetical protein
MSGSATAAPPRRPRPPRCAPGSPTPLAGAVAADRRRQCPCATTTPVHWRPGRCATDHDSQRPGCIVADPAAQRRLGPGVPGPIPYLASPGLQGAHPAVVPHRHGPCGLGASRRRPAELGLLVRLFRRRAPSNDRRPLPEPARLDRTVAGRRLGVEPSPRREAVDRDTKRDAKPRWGRRPQVNGGVAVGE